MPTYGSGAPNVDVPGIANSIRAAVAAIPVDKHGAIVVQATQTGIKAGLVVKLPGVGPVEPTLLATVEKPISGAFGWSVGVTASFLMEGESPKEGTVEHAFHVAAEVAGMADLLMKFGRSPVTAFAAAWAVHNGEAVTLYPRWS